MKALEKIKDMIDFCDAIGCHRALYESLKAVEAELEALQPRSCEGCEYDVSVDYCKYDESCVRAYHPDRYEPKEQWDERRVTWI